ncbi:unnamed protein product, partial [Rotaria sordida]
ALHIHISDETYKLLDQKLYVFEEHSKMTKNGSLLMNTYFVLNKKDRSENIQIGPFHHVFEEMKRQEIEETKLKQTTIVKSAKIDDSLPLTSKSNGFLQSLSASNSISRLAGSVELTVSNKINNNHIISHLAENSITNPRIDNNQSSKMHETANEPRQSIKSFQGRLRSRTSSMINHSISLQNERIKRRHFVLLALIFLISISSLLTIYILFPNIDPEEKSAFKIPKTIDDAKILGSIFLSILARFLYPFPIALFLVCLCSSLGASFCYLLSKLFGRRILLKYFRMKIIDWQRKVQKHSDSLLWFIIFLRITPILPNWFINLCSPIIDVPLKPFFFGTFVGVALPSILFIQAGKTIHQLSSPLDVFFSGVQY